MRADARLAPSRTRSPAQVASHVGIDGAFIGLIFAAYPCGMALTSLVAPAIISRLGTRTAVAVGLLCTSTFTLLFGLAPDLSGEGLERASISRWLFLALYFLNGLTGSTAETACLITLTRHFGDRIGTVMAAVRASSTEPHPRLCHKATASPRHHATNPAVTPSQVGTVSGVGCMLGPMIGGMLYAAPRGDPRWAFRAPFIACAGMPLLVLPALRRFMPQVRTSPHASWRIASAHILGYMPQEYVRDASGQPTSPRRGAARRVVSLSLCLGLASTTLSGAEISPRYAPRYTPCPPTRRLNHQE